jgi:hypothetical protein
VSEERVLGLIFRRAVFDNDVLALDETCFLQALTEGGHKVRSVSERSVPQETNNRNCRLLRIYCKRPHCRGAAEQRDELAPFLIELHAIPHEERGAPQDIELAAISQGVVSKALTISANSGRVADFMDLQPGPTGGFRAGLGRQSTARQSRSGETAGYATWPA